MKNKKSIKSSSFNYATAPSRRPVRDLIVCLAMIKSALFAKFEQCMNNVYSSLLLEYDFVYFSVTKFYDPL